LSRTSTHTIGKEYKEIPVLESVDLDAIDDIPTDNVTVVDDSCRIDGEGDATDVTKYREITQLMPNQFYISA